MVSIPSEVSGWWRIVDTGAWGSNDIDILGPALLSLTGRADRLRMFVLLAYVNARPTKTGVSFTWEGAWEFAQGSGAGTGGLGRGVGGGSGEVGAGRRRGGEDQEQDRGRARVGGGEGRGPRGAD